MKILVIGSGSREHALAWKFAQSEKVTKVFAAPGNGGTAAGAKCENVVMAAREPASGEGQEELVHFALREKICLTVVGPELPLAEGIVDRFRAKELAIIGPDRNAARLEASKIYSKAFMEKYGVRAAKSVNCTGIDEALAHARGHFSAASLPLVIKADGLAAGKGVVIAESCAEAEAALSAFMQNKSLGEAGASVLLEEFLAGTEVSVLAAVSVVSGKGYILPFVPARDHKRRFEGGRGPNTGGMGAIAPVPDFSAAAQSDFIRSILEPTLNGIKAEGMDYRGFIFFGLMVCQDRCYLLEYNVRLGDPETQAVLPLMDFDLTALCAAILDGRDFHLTWKQGAVCAPVAVAGGYPGPSRTGDPISIDTAALAKTGAVIFSGGAQRENGILRTSGGRVLTVSAFGGNAAEARANAYQGLEALRFEGMGYRKDIGQEITRQL
jgi:phosphoribosylamine--glycine ligase